MFVDEATVHLRAGNGGRGCMSFRRERYIPFGGPDGGDGGHGGDLILVCDHNAHDFTEYRYQPNWAAENGQPGQGRLKYGRSGQHCILKVPQGTLVVEPESGRQVAELLKDGDQAVLLRGGKGGRGNNHFKSSINRAPRQFEVGEPGEIGTFHFILKTIAQVGLVGFPNAGKSSLIRCITAAHPKTGAYPFTTLFPSVGVVNQDQSRPGPSFTVADIPGLIEGAHENRGLGHRFLKHIERCDLLVLVLDTSGQEGRDPLEDYRVLEKELGCYNPALLAKPRIVAANKMDLPESAHNLKRLERKLQVPIFPICCELRQGLEELVERLGQELEDLQRLREAEQGEAASAPSEGLDMLPGLAHGAAWEESPLNLPANGLAQSGKPKAGSSPKRKEKAPSRASRREAAQALPAQPPEAPEGDYEEDF